MNARMSTGSGMLFMPGKRLLTGGRIVTRAVHIHRWIAKLRLNMQRTGKAGNMKKNQPTRLTEDLSNIGGRLFLHNMNHL